MEYTTPGGEVSAFCDSLTKQNHTLIAGASGSGKSVLVNGFICALLHKAPTDTPGGARFILIDPKRVELSIYKSTPHCIAHATEPDEMIKALKQAVAITESRYKVMEKNGERMYSGGDIWVFIEELADLMTTNRRAVQPLIQRLCQIARAARVHVVCITQCPLVKVIPTEIKVNFDSIVALRTRSAQDSRNIIGASGAEMLPKYGKALYYTPDFIGINLVDVPYITDEEQTKLVKWWINQAKPEPKPIKKRFRFF